MTGLYSINYKILISDYKKCKYKIQMQVNIYNWYQRHITLL